MRHWQTEALTAELPEASNVPHPLYVETMGNTTNSWLFSLEKEKALATSHLEPFQAFFSFIGQKCVWETQVINQIRSSNRSNRLDIKVSLTSGSRRGNLQYKLRVFVTFFQRDRRIWVRFLNNPKSRRTAVIKLPRIHEQVMWKGLRQRSVLHRESWNLRNEGWVILLRQRFCRFEETARLKHSHKSVRTADAARKEAEYKTH